MKTRVFALFFFFSRESVKQLDNLFQKLFEGTVIFILSFRHQVPLHLLVKKFLGDYPNYGNMVVWLSIILGQPLAILTYVHDYYITHQ